MGLTNPRFEESYSRIFGDEVTLGPDADDFFLAFYKRFLRDKAIADLFADSDMPRQVGMLRRSLFQFVSYYLVSSVTPEIVRLAKLHTAMQIPDEMFDVWLETLLATVEEFDPSFDESVRLAWCWALTPGITLMKIYMADPPE
jgi:truncated hemoglobin YjbI